MPRMAFIGVRISWLMLARKRLLAWLAASALAVGASSSGPLFGKLLQGILIVQDLSFQYIDLTAREANISVETGAFRSRGR